MYKACLFFRDSFAMSSGNSLEDCLEKLSKNADQGMVSGKALTYKPADGTIYLNHHHVPCGIVYRIGG